MDSFQKWLMVVSSLIFAVGVLCFGIGTILNSFTGRYHWAELETSSYLGDAAASRYDTWTGEIQVKGRCGGGKFCWSDGINSSWIRNVK